MRRKREKRGGELTKMPFKPLDHALFWPPTCKLNAVICLSDLRKCRSSLELAIQKDSVGAWFAPKQEKVNLNK